MWRSIGIQIEIITDGILFYIARILKVLFLKHRIPQKQKLNAAFISVFTSETGLQKFEDPEMRRKVWSKEAVPLVEWDQVREYLSTLLNLGERIIEQTGHT